MYKRILIATDGSELAGRAVDHGIQLANTVGAEVVIVTVTEIWSAFEVASEAERRNFDAVKFYESAAQQSADAILNKAKDQATSMGVTAAVRHVSDREPAEGILETAQLEDCDLIVMASHGRRGLRKVLMGSQTSEVIALGQLPVLVVR